VDYQKLKAKKKKEKTQSDGHENSKTHTVQPFVPMNIYIQYAIAATSRDGGREGGWQGPSPW
jgi:hypothetical protein